MPTKIQIEVNSRVITLTIEEARNLYDELALLFKRDGVCTISPSPQWHPLGPVWTKYYDDIDTTYPNGAITTGGSSNVLTEPVWIANNTDSIAESNTDHV